MADILVLSGIHPDALALLRDSGLSLTEAPQASYEEACRLVPGHRAILTRVSVRVDRELLDRADRLKVVAISSVGMDHVDLDEVARRGLACFNAAGGNAQAVAELAVGNAIALLRQTHRANVDLHQGTWDRARYPGAELDGKTVGIVGLGAIGSRVARLLLAFGAQVIARDPYVRYVWDASLRQSELVPLVSLEELLHRSDIVTVHVPLTPETRRMFSTPQFRLMKRSAYFMNYSRGPVVDEPALAEALGARVIAGAAIDVYETEPATKSPLLQLDNCLLTPHIAGTPPEALRRMGMIVAQRLIEELRRPD